VKVIVFMTILLEKNTAKMYLYCSFR